ncbi:hypothetical protein JOQ06_000503 [Pogonophryne albipinna]|uniref:Uncharacterized protein n=1 Tax=Pogonophryne albipinna TaxID=1090488 RepID=A0AAD6AGA9_9TELE|nr:hypothetical protein JOQ06_000503 [Pogonophryne albipinna]
MSAIKDLRRDIQMQLHQLINFNESDVLYKLAASIDDEAEEELPGDDATAVELYDFIVDFLKSDQLASQEDQGMSRLLVFNDLITELQQLSEAVEEHRELNTETETQATPSVMNVKADKSPVVTSQDGMKEHTEMMSPEVVSEIWQGNKAVQESDVPWVAALQLDGGNADILSPENVSTVTPENILAAQREHPAITEVVSLKIQNWTPNERDKRNMRKETPV